MNEGQEKIYNELISKYNFNKTQKEEIKLGLKKEPRCKLVCKA